MKWYVLQFTPTRFNSVFIFLNKFSDSWFCPMEHVVCRRADKIISFRKKHIPLFPGYLFVHADFECVPLSKYTAYQYIQRFVSFGSEPVPVQDEIIQGLMNREMKSDTPRGIKFINHDFASILLIEDSEKRNIAFLNYITDKYSATNLKRKEHDSINKNSEGEKTTA